MSFYDEIFKIIKREKRWKMFLLFFPMVTQRFIELHGKKEETLTKVH